MKIETKNLVRVNTMARERNLTVQAIYKRIAHGSMDAVVIDGMTFVVRPKEGEGKPCQE